MHAKLFEVCLGVLAIVRDRSLFSLRSNIACNREKTDVHSQ
jgi:hypothetical protein